VQSSYLSQNSPVLHFGLGAATRADSVELLWPDGAIDTWTDVAGGRSMRLDRGLAEPTELWSAAGGGVRTVATGVPLNDRERTRRFWEVFREATRLRTAGEIERARTLYAEAHDLHPEHEDALYYLGGVQAELGEFEAALASLDRLVGLNPRGGRGHLRRGALLSCPAPGARIDLEGARRSFEAAETINPEQVGPGLWLGIVDVLEGRWAAAAERFDTVLGSDAGNVGAAVFRGFVAWKQGDSTRARALFERSMDGLPDRDPDEIGLREGDTMSSRSLFAGASSCVWLEEALQTVTRSSGAERAFGALDALLADAARSPSLVALDPHLP
jgi:tetratricopeptide (TPR) repeat protein